MTDPDRRTACQERNRVFGVEEELDPVAPDSLRNCHLVPAKNRPSRQCYFLNVGLALIGPDEGRVAVQQNELMTGSKIQQSTQEPAGVNPDSATVLIVVPQHEADAHVSAPRDEPSSGKLHRPQRPSTGWCR